MTRRLHLSALVLGLAAVSLSAQARDVEDMRGRRVTLPDTIEKVFATSPPGTYLVYAIDPELVAGLNFPAWESEKKYTVPRFQRLPVIGGTVGMGRTINQEVLLRAKPDVILIWDWLENSVNVEYEAIFRRMGIPWIYVQLDSIWDYPDALAITGRLLGRAARGKELRDRARVMLTEVKTAVGALTGVKRPSVYYAEGTDGLSTEGRDSLHAELIEVAGARNVHEGGAPAGYGMAHISLEQVMAYDPDVILVKEQTFYDTVYRDPRWAPLRAVRSHRVHLIPHVPFNWFDRPPSFMRLLGAEWLFSVLYPNERRLPDLAKQTQAFYRQFLGVTLDDKQAAEVLGR